MESTKEETAIVLDFLPYGYPFGRGPAQIKMPVVQAVGKNRFVLLELASKKGIHLQPHEEVYIGEGKRDKIHHIIGKLVFDKLTITASNELYIIVEGIVRKNEKKFVDFFNKAQPLSTRMHQLELLPGVGKKHMWEIINIRNEKQFESFEDIKTRVKLIPDPEKTILKRIMEELKGNEKYRLFVDT